MKRIVTGWMIVILLTVVVFAEPRGVSPSGSGQMQKNRTNQSTGGSQVTTSPKNGSGQQIHLELQTTTPGKNKNLTTQQQQKTDKSNASGQQNLTQRIAAVKQKIQEKKEELSAKLQAVEESQQKIYRNQNKVREVVHALLSLENLTGGIGKNVSQIARHFNNSLSATIRAEEKIQTRSTWLRFFWGGDQEAAGELEQQIIRNRKRIRELENLTETGQINQEIKALLQEQLSNLEQEQSRLSQLVQSEKGSRGLLGRLFGWLHL